MSKGLEALKEKYLKLLYGTNTPISMEETLLFANIEKELKERDDLAQRLWIVTCENSELLSCKQALEIIKEKDVNFGLFKACCNSSYEEYKESWLYFHKGQFKNLNDKLLTQEEYDLLREVLL